MRGKKPQKILLMSLICILLTTLCACVSDEMPLLPKVDMARPLEDDVKIPFSLNAANGISADSLVQALCFAINEDYPIKNIYKSLPSFATNEISEEDFRSYLKALAPVGGEKIISYYRLPQSEAELVLNKVLTLAPKLADLALTSSFYRIDYVEKSSSRRDNPEENYFIVAVQEQELKGAYLAQDWLTAIQEIYTYSSFYFDAIENEALAHKSPDALSFLLQTKDLPLDPQESENYCDIKAQRIVDYYSSAVSTAPTASKCQVIVPGYALYIQEYRYGGRLSGIREVKFFATNGQFTVSESIPEKLDLEERQLKVYNEPVFLPELSAGQRFSAEDLHPLLGEVVDIQELEESAANDAEKLYQIDYYGLSLRVRGTVELQSKSWQGKIESVTLHSGIFSLGENLAVGSDFADFLYAHPFYYDNSGLMQMNSLFRYCILDFELDKSGNVVSITIRPDLSA